MTRMRRFLPLVLAGALFAGQTLAVIHGEHALQTGGETCATCLHAGHVDAGVVPSPPAYPDLAAAAPRVLAPRTATALTTRRHHPIRAPPALPA